MVFEAVFTRDRIQKVSDPFGCEMVFEAVFTRDRIQKVSDPFGCEMIFEGVFTRDRRSKKYRIHLNAKWSLRRCLHGIGSKSIGSIWMRNDL